MSHSEVLQTQRAPSGGCRAAGFQGWCGAGVVKGGKSCSSYQGSDCYKHLVGLRGGTVVKNVPASAGDEGEAFNPRVRKSPWRRKWQPIPVFLPKESHGQEPGEQQSMGLQSWTQLSGLGRGIGWVKYHRTCYSYQDSDCYKHLVNFWSSEKAFRKFWAIFFLPVFLSLLWKSRFTDTLTPSFIGVLTSPSPHPQPVFSLLIETKPGIFLLLEEVSSAISMLGI